MSELEAMRSEIELKRPYWCGYRDRLAEIIASGMPAASAMNAWLPPGLESSGGQAIRFVPADSVPGIDYERHIFETGEVSTRANSAHDLFNAMVWSRFPALKVAMNACHYRELPAAGSKARSRFRDALTLFDESGAIICSPHTDLLQSLAQRDWREAFLDQAALWADTRVLICGHALLEKFPRPYKSITAKVLLLHDPGGFPDDAVDRLLAQELIRGHMFSVPADLSPLPLMGIPGWWSESHQDDAFYADATVFRAPHRPEDLRETN